MAGLYFSRFLVTFSIRLFKRDKIHLSNKELGAWILDLGWFFNFLSSKFLVPSSAELYVLKKVKLFQRFISFLSDSLAVPYPNFKLSAGFCLTYSQRITSTPIFSAASSNQIVFPLDLCISSPLSSRTEA